MFDFSNVSLPFHTTDEDGDPTIIHAIVEDMLICSHASPYGTTARSINVVNSFLAPPIDEARKAWDELDFSVRACIVYTARERRQKITAIKALRALTNLDITDAKRAVEDFPA